MRFLTDTTSTSTNVVRIHWIVRLRLHPLTPRLSLRDISKRYAAVMLPTQCLSV